MVKPLRILLTTAHPYPPELHGGAQSSMDQLARRLLERGHSVAVLSGLIGVSPVGLRARLRLKLGRTPFVRDRASGYPVFRAWDAAAAASAVAASFRPDVVVPQSGFPVRMAKAFAPWGVPVVIWFRNVEDHDLGGDPRGCARAHIANSRFTAAHLAERWGLEATVILPMIEGADYHTPTTGTAVTFINPHPLKGRDLALALARALPDVPFLLVRAWTLDLADETVLERAAAECPNITLLTSTGDMRAVYARTRVVLAPSQWREAFGRIAAEAQVSGIPVLASDIGGLLEAVGDGGVLLPPDAPVDRWAEELRRMLDDPEHYQKLSDAALRHADRPAMNIEQQVDQFVDICRRLCHEESGVAGAAS